MEALGYLTNTDGLINFKLIFFNFLTQEEKKLHNERKI